MVDLVGGEVLHEAAQLAKSPDLVISADEAMAAVESGHATGKTVVVVA